MTSMAKDLQEQLREFYDHKEIADKLAVWCRSADTREMGPLADVFDENVEWDFGMGTVDHSLAAVVERMTAHLTGATHCGQRQIHLANLRIEVDGDAAHSDAYFFCVSAGLGSYEGQALLEWGLYDDTWQRGPAGWRIVKRHYEMRIQNGPLDILYGSAPAEMWQEGDHRRLDH